MNSAQIGQAPSKRHEEVHTDNIAPVHNLPPTMVPDIEVLRTYPELRELLRLGGAVQPARLRHQRTLSCHNASNQHTLLLSSLVVFSLSMSTKSSLGESLVKLAA